ncbi:MAG: hypothetical protein R2819_00260 [Allomuricauda sp.]
MDSAIIIALISLAGSIIVASMTYYLSKKEGIRKEWRNEKINHYRKLLSSISDLAIDGQNIDEANLRFAEAVNTIGLVAPQAVVTALMNFHDEIKFSNPNKSIKKHDELLVELILEIRKDIKIQSKDKKDSFKFHLVGTKPKK